MELEVTEGTPDLGVTSYWTDAEGNVVFGPNTPKEKMKATVVGTKMKKRKESVSKTLPMEKVEEENKERKSEEMEVKKDGEKVSVNTAEEVKPSASEQTHDVKEETDQSDVPELPEPEAEISPE